MTTRAESKKRRIVIRQMRLNGQTFAQNEVLRKMQAELDAMRASLKISYDMADALLGGNEMLRAENTELRAALDRLNSNWRVNLTEYK